MCRREASGCAGVSGPQHEAVALLLADGWTERYLPTVASLRKSHPDLRIVAGAPDGRSVAPLVELGAEAVAATTLAALVNQVWEERRGHALVISEPTVFPSDFMGPALAAVRGDMSVSTVSFLCNAAGFLSFPFRNTPMSHQVESLDEEAITRRLRETSPSQLPAPIPFCTGPAVLVSAFALSAVGLLNDLPGLRPAVALADFSLRAREKGFLDLLDPGTYCSRPYDLGALDEPELTEHERRWLAERHPYFAELARQEAGADDSALGIVHATGRAKVLGLRVLVDGSCLGPKEMGTQVQTSSLVAALSRRSDVERVHVALATTVPRYAAEILAHPKVEPRHVADGDVSGFGRVDIGHRPFQPTGPLHPSWAKVAARTAVTIQDLTSYHVGIYHVTPEEWLFHREAMRRVAAGADGVIAISHVVKSHLQLERLPVDPERVFVVENGTDHLSGDESTSPPTELLARGFVTGHFALVLGTNYAHKNREIAIDVVSELRRRGLRLSIVLAGAAVPFGSSRIAEARSGSSEEGVYAIPDVTSEERNWLLRHASVVLYPTSAEGFGLVPYEAAWLGAPTVFVPFGPLGVVVGDLPVTAADWTVGSLADAAERLLDDPATSERQVAAALASGQDFTWEATAGKLVDVYRWLLAHPVRGGDAR